MLAQASTPRNVRDLLAFEVERAEQLLRSGLPLVDAMPRGLQGSIWMFAHGGLKILEKNRAIDFDVPAVRPRVTKLDQLRLLAGCLWRNASRGEAPR